MELKSVEDTSWLQLFIKNSLSHLVTATPERFVSRGYSPSEAHLLPKLRCQFAEFLHQSSPNALVFSTCPPVSV